MADELDSGFTDDHLDNEVFILKPEDQLDTAPTDTPPPPKPHKTPKDHLETLITAAHKPAVWIGASAALIIGLFAVLGLGIPSTPELFKTQPPLGANRAIAPSKDERGLIKESLQASNVEQLISKAALLYSKGNVNEALDIYEEISVFSQSLSLYNLGVSRMQKGEFDTALLAFDAHIEIDDSKTVGAINAAVCALNLGNEKQMRRYIDIARENLYKEATAPLYGYYATLINYYDDRPFETLIAAASPSVGLLTPSKTLILSKVQLLFDDPAGSFASLEAANNPQNLFVLGQLYARHGDWENAADRLEKAISADVEPLKSRAALLLVHLKSGFFGDAAKLITEIENNGSNPFLYPVQIKLKSRLFDVDLAQQYFVEHLLIDEHIFLQALFTQIPYTMIDPDKSLREIRKGELALSQGEVSEAETFLEGSAKLSGVGALTSVGIKLAVNNRLLLANQTLASLEATYKNSDTLEYNLALTYAQLDNFPQAYLHFRRAFFLNRKNVEAGVYALVLAPYAQATDAHLLEDIAHILGGKNDERSRFMMTLLSFYDRNYQATAQWLERKERSEQPAYLLLDLFAADRINNHAQLGRAAKTLVDRFPKDLLFAMFYLYVEHKDRSIKQFAFDAQAFMISREYNFDSLYYGSPVVRDLYIKLALITGNLEGVRKLLLERLAIERGEVRNIMQSLVMVDIYRQNFEEAYTFSNSLIDEMKQTDTKTLLYAAVASIGAGHKENAITLLQLAKREKNREARYALGLLYQEIGNLKGAALEYSLIGNEYYESGFFDFDIRPATDPELPLATQEER